MKPGPTLADLSEHRERSIMAVRDGYVIAHGPHEYDPLAGKVYRNGQPSVPQIAKLWAGAHFMFLTLAVIEQAARDPGPDPAATLAAIAEAAAAARPLPTMGESKPRLVVGPQADREEG